jgi:O-antigen/teichoic acid export membrane protein
MGVVIRQSVKGSIVNYVGAFVGFLTTFFILTRFLTQEEIGLTRVLISSATLVAALAQLGTSNSIIRFFPYFRSEDKKHNGLFGLSILIPFLGLIAFCTLYLLLKQPVVHFFSKESALFLDYFYYVILFAVFIVYVGVFETYSSVLYRIVVPRFIREVGIRIMTIVVYLLWAFRFVTFDTFVLLFILVYGIAAILNLMYIFALNQYSFKPNFEIAKTLQKNFYSYTAFLLPAALGGTIIAMIDNLMVGSMLGLGQTGIFTIAYFIAVIIDIPYRSLSAISLPVVSNYIKVEDYISANTHYKKLSLNQLLIGCLIFILIWTNIESIYKILPNGDQYVSGIYVVLFIALARLLDSGFNFGLSILSLSKYYYYYLFFIFFLAGLGIVTNLIFIPIYGITGAALSTFISFVIYNLLVIFIVYKKMKILPFSSGMLKIATLAGVLLVVNYLISPIANPYVDIAVRGLLTSSVFILIAYFWKISQDTNHVIRTILNRGKQYVIRW